MLNLSPDTLQNYIESARTRERDRQNLLQQRREEALNLAQKAAALLKQEFGATQVILFGSLLTDYFHEHSDIDLAVIGLPKNKYFQAVGKLLALGNFDFDLVEMDETRSAIYQAITQGIIL